MESLTQQLETSNRALLTLDKVLSLEANDIVRDAALKRFQYTSHEVSKLAQSYLRAKESLDMASPRRVIRSCFELGFLDETQTKAFLDMLNDRNLTTHTYDEETAQAIYSRLKSYHQLLKTLVDRIEGEMIL